MLRYTAFHLQKPTRFGLVTILSLGLIFSACNFPPQAQAVVSSDADYSIELEDISTERPQPTPTPPAPLTQTLYSTNAFSDSNYIVSGSNDSIFFQLSQPTIDFGALSATNPVIRTSEMKFSGPPSGAQVFGYQNTPLISLDRQTLPDTTCDNGACSQNIAAPWTSSLTYGFGYRCESKAKFMCDQSFEPVNTFKQFPDVSANESIQPIILNRQAKQDAEAKIIYKVNMSRTQSPGGYSNTITFLAIPNF